jgi:hypothetical protein
MLFILVLVYGASAADIWNEAAEKFYMVLSCVV